MDDQDPFAKYQSESEPPKASGGSPPMPPAHIFDDADGPSAAKTNVKIGIAVAIVAFLAVTLIFGYTYMLRWVDKLQEGLVAGDTIESSWEAVEAELAKEPTKRDWPALYTAFREAAMAGHEPAMIAIGLHYVDGRFIYEDPEQSKIWFTEASEAGSVWARYFTGYRYLMGEPWGQNVDEALHWLTLAATASPDEDGTFPEEVGQAALYLGSLYFHPKFGKEDKQKAFEWFYEAAQKGVVEAQFLTADGFRRGWGGKKSGGKAKYWRATALKDDDPEALVRVAYMYYAGVIVPKDDKRAAKLYQTAAKKNDPAALYDLASLYETGSGVAKDLDKAIELYKSAGELGHREAAFALGHIYRYGTYGNQDFVLAADWLARAEQLGSVHASYTLGQLHEFGKGVEKDTERALELYRAACWEGEWIGCAYQAALQMNSGVETGQELFESVIEYYTQRCHSLKDEIECYNMACIYSLVGRKPEALAALESAMENGYADYDHMRADDDLANLRNEPRFKRLFPADAN